MNWIHFRQAAAEKIRKSNLFFGEKSALVLWQLAHRFDLVYRQNVTVNNKKTYGSLRALFLTPEARFEITICKTTVWVSAAHLEKDDFFFAWWQMFRRIRVLTLCSGLDRKRLGEIHQVMFIGAVYTLKGHKSFMMTQRRRRFYSYTIFFLASSQYYFPWSLTGHFRDFRTSNFSIR